jgi:threonine dehydrogenase-like Zn-dependent dehydrogenase
VDLAFRKSLRMEWIGGIQRKPGLRSFRQAIAAITAGEIRVDHCLEYMVGIEDAPSALAAARDRGDGAAKVGFVLAGAGH